MLLSSMGPAAFFLPFAILSIVELNPISQKQASNRDSCIRFTTSVASCSVTKGRSSHFAHAYESRIIESSIQQVTGSYWLDETEFSQRVMQNSFKISHASLLSLGNIVCQAYFTYFLSKSGGMISEFGIFFKAFSNHFEKGMNWF